MAANDASSTEIHVYKPDEQGKNHWKRVVFFSRLVLIGNTVVIEAEKNWTNNDDPNASNVSESHHQKEQIIIENPNDSISTVTHQLEDIHVTVKNETVVPIENKLNQANENAAETVHAVQAKANDVQGKIYFISISYLYAGFE
jgi:hypothetical protein